MGRCAVAACAQDGQLENVGAGHHRAGHDPDLTEGQGIPQV